MEEAAGGGSETAKKNFEGGHYNFHRYTLDLNQKGFEGPRISTAIDSSEESSVVAMGFLEGDIAIIDANDGSCKRRLSESPDSQQSPAIKDLRLLARGKKLVTGGYVRGFVL